MGSVSPAACTAKPLCDSSFTLFLCLSFAPRVFEWPGLILTPFPSHVLVHVEVSSWRCGVCGILNLLEDSVAAGLRKWGSSYSSECTAKTALNFLMISLPNVSLVFDRFVALSWNGHWASFCMKLCCVTTLLLMRKSRRIVQRSRTLVSANIREIGHTGSEEQTDKEFEWLELSIRF